MTKQNELLKLSRAELKAMRELAESKMNDEEWLAQRRGSAAPKECFDECRKNIKMLIKIAKMKNKAAILSGLNYALAAVNDADKTIFDKYCS